MIHHELPSKVVEVNHAEDILENRPDLKLKFFNFFDQFNKIRLYQPQWESREGNRIALIFTARHHPYFVYLIYYAIISLWRYSDLWLADIIVQCDDSQYELGKEILGGLTTNIQIINPDYNCKIGFSGENHDILVYFDADAFMYGENYNLFRSFLGLRDIRVVSNYMCFNDVRQLIPGIEERLIASLNDLGWSIELGDGWARDYPHTCFLILPLRHMPQDWPLYMSDYCKFDDVFTSDELALYLFSKSHKVGWRSIRDLIPIKFSYRSTPDQACWVHPWHRGTRDQDVSDRLMSDENAAELFRALHNGFWHE